MIELSHWNSVLLECHILSSQSIVALVDFRSGPQSFKQSTFLIMSFGCVCGGMIVGLMWVVVAAAGAASSEGHLRASDGVASKYQGYQFWHPNQTLSVKTLVETPFARTQMHTVKLENGDVRKLLFQYLYAFGRSDFFYNYFPPSS